MSRTDISNRAISPQGSSPIESRPHLQASSEHFLQHFDVHCTTSSPVSLALPTQASPGGGGRGCERDPETSLERSIIGGDRDRP